MPLSRMVDCELRPSTRASLGDKVELLAPVSTTNRNGPCPLMVTGTTIRPIRSRVVGVANMSVSTALLSAGSGPTASVLDALPAATQSAAAARVTSRPANRREPRTADSVPIAGYDSRIAYSGYTSEPVSIREFRVFHARGGREGAGSRAGPGGRAPVVGGSIRFTRERVRSGGLRSIRTAQRKCCRGQAMAREIARRGCHRSKGAPESGHEPACAQRYG